MHQHGRSFALFCHFRPVRGHTGRRYAYDIVGHRGNGVFKQLNLCFVLDHPVQDAIGSIERHKLDRSSIATTRVTLWSWS